MLSDANQFSAPTSKCCFLSKHHKALYKPSQIHSHKDYFMSRHWNRLDDFFKVTQETSVAEAAGCFIPQR